MSLDIRDRIVEFTRIKASELTPHPQNWRKHPKAQQAAMSGILKEVGYVDALMVRQHEGGYQIIDGHLRAETTPNTNVPVLVVDLDDAETALVLATFDPLAAMAEASAEHLDALLQQVNTTDAALQAMLSDVANEAGLYAQKNQQDAEPKLDQADELNKTWQVKTGDIWLVGQHRLMCGDSTKAEDIARLMNGAKAEMMFTDPPYGVDYSGGIQFDGKVGAVTNNRERLANDNSTDIYPAFLPVALPVVDGPCYMWFADSSARDVYNAVYDNACEVHALIIWHKTNATYAAMNAQYKKRHEPCLYFKPKGSTLRWCGATTEATVWSQDRDGINEFHPTQKPVALAAKAINNHEATIILDAFCGSGSTLIAAEQLNRKCYGMEISAAYCAVILQRATDAFPEMTITRE